MEKNMKFNENDADLIKKIEKFQKDRDLPSFIAAVRVLCRDALELKKISK